MTPELEKTLNELAGKFGVAADQLWDCLLKQAPISSAVELVLLVLGLAITVYCLARLYRRVRKLEKYDDWTGEMICLAITGALFGFISFLAITVDGSTIIAGFLNPQYWALHQLLSK